jgi:uncharacterized protein CbrC (UPF0167 family)
MNTAWGVIKRDDMCATVNMEATRVCSVCGANELGYTGSYYSKTEFWLCPECLKRLKKLLDKSTES